MIEFDLKKISETHYNLTLMKEVHKRSGEIASEPGDTIYTIPLELVKNYIAHNETERTLEDNVSLKSYLSAFYKNYNEVCKLLKKIL